MENKEEQEVRVPRMRRRIAVVAFIVSVLIVITVPLAIFLPKAFSDSNETKSPNLEEIERNCRSESIQTKACISSDFLQTTQLLHTSLLHVYSTVSLMPSKTTSLLLTTRTATSSITATLPAPTPSSSIIVPSCTSPASPKEASCNVTVVSADDPIEVHQFKSFSSGVWMRDSSTYWDNETIFVMKNQDKTKDMLYRYDNIQKLKENKSSKNYTLPFNYEGTGAALHDKYLYFNRESTNLVIKYDLEKEIAVAEFAIEGFEPGKMSYSSMGKSGIDLAVDELGVWVLWGSKDIGYGLKAAILDSCTNSTLYSWNVTAEAQNRIGNAFVICGVVYTINSHNTPKPKINFAFDTKTGQQWKPNIEIDNSLGYIAMVDYNPRDRLLYCWNNEKLMYYPLVLNGTHHL